MDLAGFVEIFLLRIYLAVCFEKVHKKKAPIRGYVIPVGLEPTAL